MTWITPAETPPTFPRQIAYSYWKGMRFASEGAYWAMPLVALEAATAQRGEMIEAVERVRCRHERRGTQIDRFDDVIAEVLVEPGAPSRAHPVAGLQNRLEPRAGTAAHESEMAPMPAGHQLDDGVGLAMTPRAEHNRDIAPLHGVARFS